ncbi:MAG: ATP-binding protein [Pseudomonadota bacterium]
MLQTLRRHAPWILAWCALTALGCVGLARLELAQLQEAFETDARIVHRLLSQRVVQHDAVLATLALLQAAGDPAQSSPPEQRLSSVYPQFVGVMRRDRDAPWPDGSLAAAEAQSRQAKRPALAGLDFKAGRYWLVLAADPASYGLLVDVGSTVPRDGWPMQPDTSPVRVTLEQEGQAFVVQPGRMGEGGWLFDFHKHLASASQPFDVVALRQVGWNELPWGKMLALAAAIAAALAGLLALQRQREARRRAEELLRLGQVARLNTLGELAAGMAHELNQPLTAVLANTQAARRLLDDEPPELETVRAAMSQAVEQARRASGVVGRLRRTVERPDVEARMQPVDLADAVRNALYLLEPECGRRGVAPKVDTAEAVSVMAEPVALEQVIHNLLVNALQALEKVPQAERALHITLAKTGSAGVLRVEDTGPGIAPDVLPRIFEPFFTTRTGGLGLGLSLCETLAGSMGGSLAAAHAAPRGAVFTLTLPLAPDAS